MDRRSVLFMNCGSLRSVDIEIPGAMRVGCLRNLDSGADGFRKILLEYVAASTSSV